MLVGGIRSDLEPTEERRLKQGLPGLDYEIRPTDGVAEQDGEEGELCLRGPWIVDGYERDERSASRD